MQNEFDRKSILKELEQAIIDLLIHAPFFGKFLSKAAKSIDPKHFGICLTQPDPQKIQLSVNPDYWNNLKIKYPAKPLQSHENILKRQVIHFVLNHDIQLFNFDKKTVFAIASEILVNHFFAEDDLEIFELPNGISDVNFLNSKLLNDLYKQLQNNLNINDLDDIFITHQKHFEYLKNWKPDFTDSNKKLAIAYRKQFISDVFSPNQFPNNAPLKFYLENYKTKTLPTINWKRALRLFWNSSIHTKVIIHNSSTVQKDMELFRVLKFGFDNGQKFCLPLDTSGSMKN